MKSFLAKVDGTNRYVHVISGLISFDNSSPIAINNNQQPEQEHHATRTLHTYVRYAGRPRAISSAICNTERARQDRRQRLSNLEPKKPPHRTLAAPTFPDPTLIRDLRGIANHRSKMPGPPFSSSASAIGRRACRELPRRRPRHRPRPPSSSSSPAFARAPSPATTARRGSRCYASLQACKCQFASIVLGE